MRTDCCCRSHVISARRSPMFPAVHSEVPLDLCSRSPEFRPEPTRQNENYHVADRLLTIDVVVTNSNPVHRFRLATPCGSSAAALHGAFYTSRRPSAAVGCSPLVGRPVECYAGPMTIKARVLGGRLVVDEPINLPEGTELELLPLDPGDWLDDADRAALHAALAQSQADVDAGRLVDAADVLKRLRSS